MPRTPASESPRQNAARGERKHAPLHAFLGFGPAPWFLHSAPALACHLGEPGVDPGHHPNRCSDQVPGTRLVHTGVVEVGAKLCPTNWVVQPHNVLPGDVVCSKVIGEGSSPSSFQL